MGVIGLKWVAVMVTVKKRLKTTGFSATVSNAQRQEQSFRIVHKATPDRKGSHLARKLACSFHLISFIASVMTLCSFIRKSCVCTCWKK